MTTIFVIFAFSIIVIIILSIFGCKKLQPLSEERVCICTNKEENDRVTVFFDRFNELLTDYRERRNEFWNIFGQLIVIIVIITFLVILLLLDKISSEAALPIIAGLGSFGLGKGIAVAKNKPDHDSPNKEPEKKDSK